MYSLFKGQPDPCRDLAGGGDAHCQPDPIRGHICCGSPNLLFELLTGHSSTNSLVWQALHLDLNKFAQLHNHQQQDFNINIPDIPNPIHDDPSLPPEEVEETQTNPPQKLIKPMPITIKSSPKKISINREKPIQSIIIPSAMSGTKSNRIRIGPIKPKSYVSENGPILSLLSTGHFIPSLGFKATYSAPSTVVHLQDGTCSIIVNTGLPMQRNELKSALQSKNLFGQIFNYTVITSSQPQYIGNINLFNSDALILGTLITRGTKITSSPLKVSNIVKLCSPNTLLIQTPGPTEDSITVIARNVPGMGTVAIGGSLFIQDDNLNRVDQPFTSDVIQLFESRRKVICESDWIVPGHSVPIPVSNKLKLDVEC
uniref:Uncharacterized protein n=1 Tax=Panagrolaimus superbus TaxID=310955 RepID=A0A914Z1L0_9BILA